MPGCTDLSWPEAFLGAVGVVCLFMLVGLVVIVLVAGRRNGGGS